MESFFFGFFVYETSQPRQRFERGIASELVLDKQWQRQKWICQQGSIHITWFCCHSKSVQKHIPIRSSSLWLRSWRAMHIFRRLQCRCQQLPVGSWCRPGTVDSQQISQCMMCLSSPPPSNLRRNSLNLSFNLNNRESFLKIFRKNTANLVFWIDWWISSPPVSTHFSFLPPFLFAKITHVGNNYRNLSILLPLDGSPCFPEHTHCRTMTNLMHLRAAEQHLVMTKGSLCEIQGTQPKPSWIDGISWQIYCLATPRLQSVEPKLQGWENYRLQQLRLPSDSLACGATSTSLSLNWHVWHLINQILRKKKRKNA